MKGEANMPSSLPHFTLRINPKLMQKLRYIAEGNGRSVNKETEALIKAHVEAYEKEHGPINADK
ncbi:Arc family DNA-binding protein [uncultured Anaerotruncus sp.]|uniref:Arc family DNA-binding protein n=1 Tax=uncultured Anaerotruncus sp. TaxID=905011 RepID=UPI00280BA1BB|nr:Arc family DNA-binding protein [uncultured Anaerotruncus sp.]